MPNAKKGKRKRDRKCVTCHAEPTKRCRNGRDGTFMMRDHKER